MTACAFTPRARRGDPRRVIGAKPAAMISWAFGLMDARAGDSLEDWFPGSGGVTRAWALANGPAVPAATVGGAP